jgi:hypothetical protein
MQTLPLFGGSMSACHHDKKLDAATLILEKTETKFGCF